MDVRATKIRQFLAPVTGARLFSIRALAFVLPFASALISVLTPLSASAETCLVLVGKPIAKIDTSAALLACSEELTAEGLTERQAQRLRTGVARAMIGSGDDVSARFVLEPLVEAGSADAERLIKALDAIEANPSTRDAVFASIPTLSLDAPTLAAAEAAAEDPLNPGEETAEPVEEAVETAPSTKTETTAEVEAAVIAAANARKSTSGDRVLKRDAAGRILPPVPDVKDRAAATAAISSLRRDATEELAKLRKKAEIDAIYREGISYINGTAGRRSLATGIPILERAARNGSVDAMIALAPWYSNSQFKWHNPSRAQKMLIDAYRNSEDRSATFRAFQKLPIAVRRELQRAVGVTTDGQLGSGTRAALDRRVR